MFVDNSLSFNGGWATPQAVTVTAYGSSIVDITGAGSGHAPAMINGFPATNTAIGADYGLGDGDAIPYFYLAVTKTGTTSNTLTVSLGAAPDDGSYGQGAYTQLYTTAALTGTDLIVNDYLLVPVPPTLFQMVTAAGTKEALPRFYRVTYTCSGSLTVTVNAGIVINPPSSLIAGQYNSNFLAV